MKTIAAIALGAALTLGAPAHAFTFTGNLGLDLARAAAALGSWYRSVSTFYAPYGPVYRNLTTQEAISVMNRNERARDAQGRTNPFRSQGIPSYGTGGGD